MKNAIVLCSGGLDSVVTSYYVKKKLRYSKIVVLFFDYRQKALKRERECSRACARDINAEFIEIKLNLAKISNSLINKKGRIKKLERKDLRDTRKESKRYYVPARNLIFLSYAIALAETLGNADIFVGFKNDGKESFPDTTKEFVNEMNTLAKISCNSKIRIIAPLIKKDKEDIILLGEKLGVNFRKTHSCYVKNRHCGRCLACMLRKEGFYWANAKDETSYLE